MDLPSHYQDFVDKSLTLTSQDELLRLCRDIRDSVGYSSVTCLSNFKEKEQRSLRLVVASRHGLFRYLRSKLSDYEGKTNKIDESMTANTFHLCMNIQNDNVEHFYKWDPTFNHARNSNTPTVVHAMADVPSLQKQHQVFAEGVMEFGIERFLTIPVHGPKSDGCIIRFNHTRECQLSQADLQHSTPILYFLSHYVFEAQKRIIIEAKREEDLPQLSNKQVQILKLTSKGKNISNISDALHISENTVLYHLKRIYVLLDVKNRQHAIAKAINLEILTF